MHWSSPLDFLHDGGWIAVVFFVFLGLLLLRFLIQCVICWMVYRAAESVPPEHREIEPALAFLLLVPCLDIFLNFLVQPSVARSYRRWFESRGDTSEGDCAENLAWWYAITTVCAHVPCVPFAGLVAVILQIVFLLRVSRLRSKALALTRGDGGMR